MKWIAAKDLKKVIKEDYQFVKVGDRIKIYGKETIVLGFYGAYNDGLEKWETIILTTGRGDPFERSIDQIEVCEDAYTYESPSAPVEQEGQEEMWEDVKADIKNGSRMSWYSAERLVNLLKYKYTITKK